MTDPFTRWWVMFTTLTTLLVSALIAGLAMFIVEQDKTYISWAILLVYFLGSVHLGYRARTGTLFSSTEYFVDTCTSLGLLGTIVGLIIMTGAFTTLDVSSSASVKNSLVSMSAGLGAALTTTLVGLVCALMLKCQLVVVRERWRV